jgi:divalent metal cation (Fe/Co/Zn/Cd) transporter
MIDRELLELVPHFVAMVVLVSVVLGGFRLVLGTPAVWFDPIAALLVVFLYPFAVRRLGIAPTKWE